MNGTASFAYDHQGRITGHDSPIGTTSDRDYAWSRVANRAGVTSDPSEQVHGRGPEVRDHLLDAGDEIAQHPDPVDVARFQGSWQDLAAGLVWMVTRWYDPVTARFLSEDSLLGEPRNPDSRHRYAYGQGDPVNTWDPGGREFTSFTETPTVSCRSGNWKTDRNYLDMTAGGWFQSSARCVARARSRGKPMRISSSGEFSARLSGHFAYFLGDTVIAGDVTTKIDIWVTVTDTSTRRQVAEAWYDGISRSCIGTVRYMVACWPPDTSGTFRRTKRVTLPRLWVKARTKYKLGILAIAMVQAPISSSWGSARLVVENLHGNLGFR